MHLGQYLSVYPEHKTEEAGLRFVVACLAAIFLQWGTAGASVLISYKTPSVGLGCRSGSFLLYGALSTLAWIFLVAAAACSEKWSMSAEKARLERDTRNTNGETTDRNRQGNGDDPKAMHMSPIYMDGAGSTVAPSGRQPANFSRHYEERPVLAVLSICLRLIGKTLAVISACWLVIACMFQFTNFFQNCWCASNFLNFGSRGWATVFLSSEEQKREVGPACGGGLGLTLATTVLSGIGFGFAVYAN
jgi:hypothetical protein